MCYNVVESQAAGAPPLTIGIGPFVRKMRESARMTQQDVATRSGLSRSYLSRLETGGIIRPSADYLVRIARAIGIHPDMLFKAAGYTRAAAANDDERQAVLDWLAAETKTWTADELGHWGRLMLHARESTLEWRTRHTGTLDRES